MGERNGLCVSTVPVTRLGFRRKTVECKESRIGKQPIEVPSNVVITLEGQDMKVKGPLGELALSYPREIAIDRQETVLRINKAVETRRANQMHGLFRYRSWNCCFLCNSYSQYRNFTVLIDKFCLVKESILTR